MEIRVGEVVVHYVEHGAGRPVLILHGAGVDHREAESCSEPALDGVAGLRQALLAQPDIFTGTLTEKLMTYALGRGVGYGDAPAVRIIIREAARDNYRFSAIIGAIVKSAPFQMRRTA